MISKKILTIISEYNPIHFGHIYQLNESIKKLNPDYKVAIISGNFVQRGEPSLLNKWEKAKSAMYAGFDLVIELPVIYAISSAENFASGAVKVADLIGSDYLAFGSECGDISLLYKALESISSSIDFNKLLKENLAKGYSYPKSQELAIISIFGDEFKNICLPNNILGLEYLRTLKSINSKIEPITVLRNDNYCSSSKIRNIIKSEPDIFESSNDILPDFSFDILKKNYNSNKLVYSLKAFEKEIFYKLRTMSSEDFLNIPDMQENIVANLKKASCSTNSLEKLISLVKNKSITQARIQRVLLYILLQITKADMDLSKKINPYVHILAMNDKGKEILSSFDDDLNVITSLKGFETNCTDKSLLKILEIDKRASDIYTLAYPNDSVSGLDYTNRIITF